jgi:hypothetical protein
VPGDASEFARDLARRLRTTLLIWFPYRTAERLRGRLEHAIDQPDVLAVCWTLSVLSSALPLVFASLTGYHGLEFVWLGEWGVTDALLLMVPLYFWKRALTVANSVDRMVRSPGAADQDPESSDDRWWLPWAAQWWPIRRQALMLLAGGAFSALMIIPIWRALHSELDLGVIPFLQLVATAMLGANMAWWAVASLDLCRRLSELASQRRFQMKWWWAPAASEGIQEMSGFFRAGAVWALIGAFLFSPPIVWAYLTGKSSSFFLASIIAALTGTVLVLVSIGWLPHYWLSKIVRLEKESALEALREEVGELPHPREREQWRATDQSRLSVLTVALSIQELDEVTYDFRYLLRGTVAIALSILPYVISLITKV